MSDNTFTLSVVFLREEGGWAAQCLQYDITAQGKTLAQARKAFERTLVGQVVVDVMNDQAPLAGIAQAPKKYWDRFEKAERLVESSPLRFPDSVHVPIKSADERVYA